MTIRLTGHIEITDSDLEAVLQHLPHHIRLTRAEPGCLKFEVTQRRDNHLMFDVDEMFRDKAAFEAHQKRTQTSDWATVTASAKRHYQVTET